MLPPGTRVDPELFPEDEFPVRCLSRGYELRTFVEGRCPKCGTPFERGELLVETYAREKTPRHGAGWRVTVNRVIRGFALVCAIAWSAIALWLRDTRPIIPLSWTINLIIFTPMILMFLLFLTAATHSRPPFRKRYAVWKEIRRQDPWRDSQTPPASGHDHGHPGNS